MYIFYMFTELTDADYDKSTYILDSVSVSLVSEVWSDAIYQLIREEISAVFSGSGIAKNCTTQVQSRARIPTTEHE